MHEFYMADVPDAKSIEKLIYFQKLNFTKRKRLSLSIPNLKQKTKWKIFTLHSTQRKE